MMRVNMFASANVMVPTLSILTLADVRDRTIGIAVNKRGTLTVDRRPEFYAETQALLSNSSMALHERGYLGICRDAVEICRTSICALNRDF